MVDCQVFCVDRDHTSGVYLGKITCTMDVVDALLEHFPNLGVNIITCPEDELFEDEDGNVVDP